MLFVALVLVSLVVLFAVDVISDVRFRLQVVPLMRGLRADVDHLATEFARVATEREQLDKAVQGAIGAAHQRITSTHGVAATALDRILYYTRVSKPLGRLGEAYDRAIVKVRAKMEAEAKSAAPQEAASVPTPELADVDTGVKQDARDTADETTDDDMGQIAGSIGPAATPAGMPCG